MGKDRCANPPLLYHRAQMCPPPVLVPIKQALAASKWRCIPYQGWKRWGKTGAQIPLLHHYYCYCYYYYYYYYYYYFYFQYFYYYFL